MHLFPIAINFIQSNLVNLKTITSATMLMLMQKTKAIRHKKAQHTRKPKTKMLLYPLTRICFTLYRILFRCARRKINKPWQKYDKCLWNHKPDNCLCLRLRPKMTTFFKKYTKQFIRTKPQLLIIKGHCLTTIVNEKKLRCFKTGQTEYLL